MGNTKYPLDPPLASVTWSSCLLDNFIVDMEELSLIVLFLFLNSITAVH